MFVLQDAHTICRYHMSVKLPSEQEIKEIRKVDTESDRATNKLLVHWSLKLHVSTTVHLALCLITWTNMLGPAYNKQISKWQLRSKRSIATVPLITHVCDCSLKKGPRVYMETSIAQGKVFAEQTFTDISLVFARSIYLHFTTLYVSRV